ncbi:MAG: hypothetical protein DCF15_15850 [Phormidesmis priestleyi]|uniref:Pyrrolidone-carboxylate peptidase n=1 Tax=Phormidesmis priestleyi TaxID=268141 RepID=A0A2W4X7T2_9CYAN|nr:MAG: hypothetical protein DCF15_15850 [Phormidesmis priestleyi]
MTKGPILITSFQPWRAHQRSNSSDDLMADLWMSDRLPTDTIWRRQVAVSFDLAPIQVISEIYQKRPRVVICCGMAENRAVLSLEAQAKVQAQVQAKSQAQVQAKSQAKSQTEQLAPGHCHRLKTAINLLDLLTGTYLSEVSQDAGRYVCNHLYYRVLRFVNNQNFSPDFKTVALFVHVPVLTPENKRLILHDFCAIAARLADIY